MPGGSLSRTATALLIASVPVVGIFAPLALAPTMALVAVLGLAYFFVHRRGWPLPPRSAIFLLGSLIVWSALSLAWSIDPALSASKLWRHAANLVAGGFLIGVALKVPEDEARLLSRFYLYGLLAAAVALIFVRGFLVPVGTLFPIDGGLQVPLNPYNRGNTVFAVLIWPAALYASRFGKWPAIALVLGGCALLSTYASQAALVAILLAVLAAGLIGIHRVFAVAAGAVIAVAILVMPLVPLALPPPAEVQAEFHLPGSHKHRLLIWQFSAERISERPLLGWGLESSKVIPGNTSRPDGGNDVALPLHSHNGALQIWLELGVVAALLAAALALVIGASIARLPRAAAMAAGGYFVSATSICLVSYGIWQSWWLAVVFIGAAVTILAYRLTPPRTA